MTAAEWLACDDPHVLLSATHDFATARKLRLFAVACCRRIWQRFADETLRETVRAAERYADDGISEEEMHSWWRSAAEAAETTTYPGTHITSAARAVVITARWGHFQPMNAYEICLRIDRAVHDWEHAAELQAQADLVRDIFGSPAGPPALELACVSATVRQLAVAVYEDRAFDRLPVLGDALEDAGCADADVLDHCRRPGAHVRGCWVVDRALGKD